MAAAVSSLEAMEVKHKVGPNHYRKIGIANQAKD